MKIDDMFIASVHSDGTVHVDSPVVLGFMPVKMEHTGYSEREAVEGLLTHAKVCLHYHEMEGRVEMMVIAACKQWLEKHEAADGR